MIRDPDDPKRITPLNMIVSIFLIGGFESLGARMHCAGFRHWLAVLIGCAIGTALLLVFRRLTRTYPFHKLGPRNG
jgi:uncharacterized membrane protein YccC